MIAEPLLCGPRRALALVSLLSALTGCSAASGSPSLRLPPPRPATAEGATYSGVVVLRPGLRASAPLSADQVRGRWHWRLFGLGTAHARAEFVGPDGAVFRELLQETEAGGRVVDTFVDAFGVEIHRTTYQSDGLWQRVWRSGRSSFDGCHHVVVERDPSGRRELRRCLSPSGAPMADDEGCVWREMLLDERGLVAQSSCLGRSGPGHDDGGVHRTTYVRDGFGAPREERYEDAAGRPTSQFGGCHGRRRTFHPSGDIASITCLDAAGAPAVERGRGVAVTLRESDAHGCDVIERYLDEHGQPVTSRDGVARVTYERGPRCELLGQQSYALDGSLHMVGGVAVRTHLVNEEGLTTRTACLDDHRLPTSCTGTSSPQAAVMTFEHDERGRLARRRSYFVSMVESVTGSNMPHLTETVHDDQGRVRMRRYFDEYGRPGTTATILGQELLSYDDTGLMSRVDFLSWQRTPVDPGTGCPSVVFTRDAEGRRQRIDCLTDATPNTVSPLFQSITWPTGARSVQITREPRLANVFLDHAGRVLKHVDCDDPVANCYR